MDYKKKRRKLTIKKKRKSGRGTRFGWLRKKTKKKRAGNPIWVKPEKNGRRKKKEGRNKIK